MIQQMKECSKCKTVKSIEEFAIDKSRKDLHSYICLQCKRLEYKKYSSANADKLSIKSKKWRESNKNYYVLKSKEHYNKNRSEIQRKKKDLYKSNKEEILKANKKWKMNNKERSRDLGRLSNLKRYGITEEQYQSMLLLQNGRCSVCGCTVEDNKKRLAVDHCHTTGKVRDLLCTRCNTTLGLVKENIDHLKSLISYIEKHNDNK